MRFTFRHICNGKLTWIDALRCLHITGPLSNPCRWARCHDLCAQIDDAGHCFAYSHFFPFSSIHCLPWAHRQQWNCECRSSRPEGLLWHHLLALPTPLCSIWDHGCWTDFENMLHCRNWKAGTVPCNWIEIQCWRTIYVADSCMESATIRQKQPKITHQHKNRERIEKNAHHVYNSLVGRHMLNNSPGTKWTVKTIDTRRISLANNLSWMRPQHMRWI